jgi:hypothetical protein
MQCDSAAAAALLASHPATQPPTQREYQDLIRREMDAAGSAFSTCVLVLRYVDENRVPAPYSRVVLRRAANDLRKVSQVLAQITRPPRATRAQAALLATTRRDRSRLDRLASDPNNASHRQAVRAALAADTATIDNRLTGQLDPN